MKRFLFFVLLCMLMISCASKTTQGNSDNTGKDIAAHAEGLEQVSEEVLPKIPKYIDWQYKGFGAELPEWVDYIIDGQKDNQLERAAKFFPEAGNISVAWGENSDMCLKKVQFFEKQNDLSQNEIIDSIWVKANSEYSSFSEDFGEIIKNEPYIIIRIYKNKI